MKRLVRISGLMLAMMIAGTAIISAQRGNRGMMQPGPMRMHGQGMGQMHGMNMRGGPDSLRMERMKQRMDPAGFHDQMRGMGPGRFRAPFGPGMRPPLADSLVRRGMGDRMLRDIPNLTDKQKADIGKLRTDQQAEMQKLREEFAAKMRTLREEQRNKVLGLLTDEQKKSIGADAAKPAVPAKPAAPAAKSKTTK